jgi:hypothetical protein
MPCFIVAGALFLPRLVIVLLALFSKVITAPFGGALLWPILGFIFAPYTLLAWCGAYWGNGSVSGAWVLLVVLGVLMDLGVIGGGARSRKLRRG